MGETERTVAQQIADLYDNDGRKFWRPCTDERNSNILLESQINGARVEYKNRGASGEPIAYIFADGSAIVVAGPAWDLRAKGCEAFCWDGVGCTCTTEAGLAEMKRRADRAEAARRDVAPALNENGEQLACAACGKPILAGDLFEDPKSGQALHQSCRASADPSIAYPDAPAAACRLAELIESQLCCDVDLEALARAFSFCTDARLLQHLVRRMEDAAQVG